MAKSEQQRQRKLAKKQSKERQKRKDAIRKQQQLASLSGKMLASSQGRIVHCAISDSIAKNGIGYVIFSRSAPTGEIAFVCLLIDSYCLGVKDVAAALRPPQDAEAFYEKFESRGLRQVTPGFALGLVNGAIDYARSLGFEPHVDYRKAAAIWGSVEAESIEGLFEFGKDGKPTYINGPHDDVAKQKLILNTLTRTVGTDNFTFVLGGPNLDFLKSLDALEVDESDGEDDEAEQLHIVDGTKVLRLDRTD